jgi:hypothetical protein
VEIGCLPGRLAWRRGNFNLPCVPNGKEDDGEPKRVKEAADHKQR